MAAFQQYIDKRGRWRWRLFDDEGKILASSNVSFADQSACLENIEIFKQQSEISEVRIYTLPEEYDVYIEGYEPPKQAKEIENIEEEIPAESQKEPEVNSEQPDDVPQIQQDSFPPMPPKAKKTNWALITSIVAIGIIVILIILFSIQNRSKEREKELNIVSEINTPTEEPADITSSMVTDTVSEAPILEAKIESPELEKQAEPIPKDIFHKVAKGDNLWNLADEYYSDSFLWPNIFNGNLDKIKNPDILRLGLDLLIPGLQGTYLKLSPEDQKILAVGYMRAYLIYKKLGKSDARYYLWVSQLYDQNILKDYQGQVDLKDLNAIQYYKKH
jgi:uncharacterized protein YegP (UPF0339 family)